MWRVACQRSRAPPASTLRHGMSSVSAPHAYSATDKKVCAVSVCNSIKSSFPVSEKARKPLSSSPSFWRAITMLFLRLASTGSARFDHLGWPRLLRITLLIFKFVYRRTYAREKSDKTPEQWFVSVRRCDQYRLPWTGRTLCSAWSREHSACKRTGCASGCWALTSAR